MDFYDKILEINVQLAEAMSQLHALNTYSSRKIFIKTAKEIIDLTQQCDNKTYRDLMNLAVFCISSAGLTRREVESTFPRMSVNFHLKTLNKENFITKIKSCIGYGFQEELEQIFVQSPFVPKSETVEKIKNLFEKFNMKSPMGNYSAA